MDSEGHAGRESCRCVHGDNCAVRAFTRRWEKIKKTWVRSVQGQGKLPREAKQELRPRLSRRSLQGEDTVAPPRGLDGRWGTVWLKSAFGWIFLTVIPSANGSGLQGQNLMLQIFLNQNHLQVPILSGRGWGDDPWDTSQAPSL